MQKNTARVNVALAGVASPPISPALRPPAGRQTATGGYREFALVNRFATDHRESLLLLTRNAVEISIVRTPLL